MVRVVVGVGVVVRKLVLKEVKDILSIDVGASVSIQTLKSRNWAEFMHVANALTEEFEMAFTSAGSEKQVSEGPL